MKTAAAWIGGSIATLILILAGTAAALDISVLNALSYAVTGGPQPIVFTSTQTGLDGDLADTLVGTGLNMWDGAIYHELTYHMDVTAGTTTDITIECAESTDNTAWFTIPHCTDADPATCGTATATYGITDTSVTVKPRAQYARCTFDDVADGTGTLEATATKSAP